MTTQAVDPKHTNSVVSTEGEVRKGTNVTIGVDFVAAEKPHLEVSVIIPVYNQEKEISDLLSRIRETLSSTFSSYEVIIVDDGSSDNTLELLREEEQKSNSNLHVISYPLNRGKGYAVREGVLKSTGSLVLFIDGDLEISPHVMGAYINEIQNYDMVIASKAHTLSNIKAPISRRFLSRAFNLLARTMVGIQYRDTQCGMKVGKGETLRLIFKTMLVRRYAFDIELLIMADLYHLRVKEMPIDLTIYRRFKVKEITRMALDLMAITYRLKISRWYYKQMLASTTKKQENEN